MNDEESVIAIDIGGGSTKLARIDRRGTLNGWQSFPTAASTGAVFVERVAGAASTLREQAAVPVIGLSVAVAGFVSDDGELEYNANLPWLERTPIATLLADSLGLPTQIDADSNAACVAEYKFGIGRGSTRFLCLTGGTGLGVGMMAGGKLLRIAHGCMGDAGHIIVSPEGPVCSCGGRGCAEALLSTASLAKRYSEIGGYGKVGFRALVEDGKAGRPEAKKLLEEAGYWLGIAAASLASIFLPDRIAVAGGLSQSGDLLMLSAQASFRTHGGDFPLARATLERASTSEHATLLGAAASFFYPELL
jgi:glucokinase